VAERALRIGRKHNVYAVEIDGNTVRYIFQKDEKPKSPKGGKTTDRRASCTQIGSSSDAASRAQRPLNHAQRKSARRLQEFLKAKRARNEKAEESPASMTTVVAEAAPVDMDERMTGDAPATADEHSRGQKRVAGETADASPRASALTTAQAAQGSSLTNRRSRRLSHSLGRRLRWAKMGSEVPWLQAARSRLQRPGGRRATVRMQEPPVAHIRPCDGHMVRAIAQVMARRHAARPEPTRI